MANYYASARSNYFQVKDSKVFEEWVDSIPGLGIFTKQGDSATLYAICDNGGDACGWPSYDHENDREIDLAEELAEHLAEGQVAVLIEVGAEKLRYLSGHAVAVNWKGEVEWLNLNRIYDLAEERWGIRPTAAEY